ncbi:MAG: NfeD family protein [Actinomycetes bacterium]
MPHLRRLLPTLGVVLVLAALAAPVGAAERAPSTGRGGILVVQVQGLLDPPNARLVADAVGDANRARAALVILTLDSGGAVDVDTRALVRAVRRSRVPVTVWIGPAGAEARGAAAVLAAAATVVGVGTGAHIGPAHPVRRDASGPSPSVTRAWLAALGGRSATRAGAYATVRRSANDALDLDAASGVCGRPRAGRPEPCPTLGAFLVGLDGRTVMTPDGPRTLDTARVVGTGQDRRRQPNQPVAFRKLPLTGQAEHTLTNPSIAYVLFLVGLSLILFEFFTISIGLAGGVGALAVIGACVGFAHLPVTWWAVALLLLAVFGFGVDVQTGRPAVWSGIGTVALVSGSVLLYEPGSSLHVPWWLVVVMVASVLLFMLGAMPVAVRSRFSTPTVGREGLVGRMGEAAVDVAPDGVVLIDGARWRARTNRATPVPAGAAVRVVEVDGLVLEVEPEEGGARDYREMRRGRVGDPEGTEEA